MAKTSKNKEEFEVIEVTPTMAKRWLEMDQPAWDRFVSKNPKKSEGMVGNRKINSTLVKKLTRAIQKGDWVFEGNPIKRAKEGMIIDGRHRLTACVMADEPIKALVWNNATVGSSKAMDDGVTRSYTDMLEMYGFKNPSLTRSILTKYVNWAATSYYRTTVKKETSFSNMEFLSLAKNNPQLLKSVMFAERFKKDNKNATYPIIPSIIGALHYICEDDAKSIDILTKFIKTYMDNTGGRDSIQYKLGLAMTTFMREHNVKKVPQKIWESLFISAFISYIKGDKIRTLDNRAVDPFSFKKGSRIRAIREINESVGYDAIILSSVLPNIK